jgi:DNA-binding winged helix-turn-helix (wHTH) protein/tetratricopeptide (TPR) repeat protein
LVFFWQNDCLIPAASGAVSAQGNWVYRFANCELDPQERRLLAHGHPVTLTPKVFDTLVLLVERAGHVVSKDELMTALWPRGFVHESNLTKHIWLIRRALNDGEGESRYIETVPKLGYRFVATVQCAAVNDGANGADATAVAAAVPIHLGGLEQVEPLSHEMHLPKALEPRVGAEAANSRHLQRPFAIAVMLAVVIAAGAWLTWRGLHQGPLTIAAPDSAAVAIVDFNNLSGNAKDTWLGPALEQMLATEVAANGRLHAVSEELVRTARADLPAADAGGYAPASLATLQRRLGAHYVLSGAYLVSGATDAPQLRVDLTVQDTQTDAMLASLSRSAAVKDLPQLVSQVGGELRHRFGERPFDPSTLKQIASAQPPTSEVARHVGFALQALGQYDAARARDELLQAVAEAPGYAPAYLYLARAWSMLGYRAKAIAAVKQAAQNAQGLPREQQLQIRAEESALDGDFVQASTAWGELAALRPHDPEYRLQWVRALTAAGRYPQAQAALTETRKLRALAGDPRVELAAVNIESARDDPAATIPHARLALARARQRGETGLVAEAELQLGIALDQDIEAEPLLRAAAADYRRIGNPHGEASAWQNLGNLQNARNRIPAARESYQRAMMIYQGIDDLGGEAAIYDNLSNMLWSAGDRDGTETALRQSLKIGRETNDPVREAWSLTGLATVLSDESASDQAAAMYREAIALDRRSNTRSHLAFALSYYADWLRVRGELDEAAKFCLQAQAVARDVPDVAQKRSVDFECAQIALDRGGTDRARADFAAIEQGAVAARDGFQAANTQLMLAQIDMGRGQWEPARAVLGKSLKGWTAQKETPGEATTEALLALCDAALGDDAARDQAAAQARALRGRITARQEAFMLDIALAELEAEAGGPADALPALRALAGDAVKRGWPGYAFEARLAMLRVLKRGRDRAVFDSARDTLARDASNAGFGWVTQRLATL